MKPGFKMAFHLHIFMLVIFQIIFRMQDAAAQSLGNITVETTSCSRRAKLHFNIININLSFFH